MVFPTSLTDCLELEQKPVKCNGLWQIYGVYAAGVGWEDGADLDAVPVDNTSAAKYSARSATASSLSRGN